MNRACLYSLALLLGTAAPALAAEESPGLMTVAYDLTIWSIVIFILLFLVLRKFAWGPILEGLQKREHSIENAIEEAKKVREEMAKQQAEFQRQLADANQQIPKLLEEARRDGRAPQGRNADPGRGRHQRGATASPPRDRGRQGPGTCKISGPRPPTWPRSFRPRSSAGRLAPEDHRRLVDEALAEIQALASKDQGRASEAGLEWVRKAGGKI